MARQGYAQFIKAAKSFDGSFAILEQHAPAPVGLFLLNEADDGFKGCLKMETSVFQQTGAKLGAGLMLS